VNSVVFWVISALVLVTLYITSSDSIRPEILDDIGTSLVVVVMLLISPLTWPHYFVVLLLPVILLLTRNESGHRTITIEENRGVLLTLLMLVVPCFSEAVSGESIRFWCNKSVFIQLITLSQTLGLLMIWGLLAKKHIEYH
jgi:asparagine N-glycosylation enzyme membrane subunit Stt3